MRFAVPVVLALLGLTPTAFPYEQEFRFAKGLADEGFPDLARTVLRRARETLPEEAARELEIRILIADRKFGEAREQLRATPANPALWLALAEAARNASQTDLAAEAYREYFQSAPPDAAVPAALDYGGLLEARGETEHAVALYERFCGLPDGRPVKTALARLLAEREPERARALCEEVQLGGPDFWFGRAVVIWAQILVHSGELDEARSVLETQLVLLKQLEENLTARGETVSAVSPLAGARYWLGVCYEQAGRPADALHQLCNVYIRYGASEWGPPAHRRAQALIAQLEGAGKTVRIGDGGRRRQIAASRFQQARRLLADRRFAEGASAYLEALNECPEGPEAVSALRDLMLCLIELDDPLQVQCIGCYLAERFAEFPSAADALLAAGRAALDRNRNELSDRLYVQYFAAFPSHERAPAVLYSLAGLREGPEREATWRRIAAEYPESPYAVRSLGRLAWGAFRAGQYAQAAERFDAYLEKETGFKKRVAARAALAEALRSCSEWSPALEQSCRLETELTRAAEGFGVSGETLAFIRPLHEEAVLCQAVCLAKLGETDPAVEACDRLVATFAGSELLPRARLLKGETLLAAGRFEEALAVFEWFDETADRGLLEPVLYSRGQAFLATGQCEAAVQSLEALLTRWPDSSLFFEARLLQGRALAAGGWHGDAVRVLGDVLNVADDELLIHRAGLELGRAQREPSEKLASFQRVALLADPSDPEQVPLIAEALFESLPLHLELQRCSDLLADGRRLLEQFPSFGDSEEIQALCSRARRQLVKKEGRAP